MGMEGKITSSVFTVLRFGRFWTLKRGLPLVVLALVAGAGTALVRSRWGFMPGLQGILAGIVLGWLSGWTGRHDPPVQWRLEQRFWLWANVLLSFTLSLGFVLSRRLALPLDHPLEWFRDLALGYAGEAFFGSASSLPVDGALSGWGWIGLNIVDLLLFFVLGLVAMGSAIKHGQIRRSLHDPESPGESEMNWPGTTAEAERPRARRLFLTQWGLLLLVPTAVILSRMGTAPPTDEAAMRQQLSEWTGRYVFEDGGQLLGRVGQPGAFVLETRGDNTLWATSIPDTQFSFSLEGHGSQFRGRLERGRSVISIRARFSPDGRRLQLAGPVYVRGQRSGDVLVEAFRD